MSDERTYRESDIDRRITNLEISERELTSNVNKLVVQIERLATVTENVQLTVHEITERDKKIQDLQIDVSNLKTSMKVILWIGAAIMTSGVGLAMNFLFAGG